MYSQTNESSRSAAELVKMTSAPMSRMTALKILKLTGRPSPKQYNEQFETLILQTGDPARVASIVNAHHRLRTDHRDAVQTVFGRINSAFQSLQGPYYKLSDSMHICVLNLCRLGTKYCALLEDEDADINMKNLDENYKRDFAEIRDEACQKLPENQRNSYSAMLNTLLGDINSVYSSEMVGEAALEEGEIFEPIYTFKQEFDSYLEKILQIKDSEISATQEASNPLLPVGRYQKDLQDLHEILKRTGSVYFNAIKEATTSEQVLKAQGDFNQAFKVFVDKAKRDFAKEPGIWVNLNVFLKIIFAITFIPALVIIFRLEKTEDRHRLFHGAPAGELNIQQHWDDSYMDVFPDPTGNTPKPNGF